MKKVFFAIAVVGLLLGNGTARAVDKWLDTNTEVTADSGIANGATIVWATGTSNWNTNSTGLGGTISGWTSGTADRAFLAAGADTVGRSYTLNVTSALTAGSVFVEEGTITKSGAALTVNQIDIASGASFVYNASGGLVPTGTAPAVTLHGTGATFGYTAGGAGGTFLNTGFGIILDGGGTLTDSVGNPNIYGGVISGTGDLVKTGAGILSLTNTSTYTGNTIVNGGTLRLRTGTPQIPNTALTVTGTGGFDAATFNQTVQSLSGNGKLPFSGSGTLTIAGTASTTFSGVWSGSGRINVNKSGGTGTLTLTGVNTGTGRFTVTNGTVTVDPGAALGGSVMDLEVNGGTLNLNNAAQSVEGLAGTGGTINLATGHMLTVDPVAAGTPINNVYSGVIAGDGGLTKVNVISGATVRTQTLAGNNTYNGNTFVRGGILSVQHANALGSTTGFTEVSQVGAVAAELLFTTAAGSVTTSEPLRISGNGAVTDQGAIAVTAGATPTISGPVTLIGDSTLTVSGTSSVLYNNANSITSLANQNLTLAGGSGTSPLGIGTISGAIALGTGSLTKNQGGTWVLSGSNSYTGATNINAGVLSVSNVGNTGASSNLGQNGTINLGGATTTTGTLRYTGTGETSDKVVNLAGTTGGGTIDQSGTGVLRFTSNLTATGSGAKTLTLTGSTAGTGEIAGTIAENGGATSVTKSGTGTWALTAANTYTGPTTINNGTLAANNTTGSATGSGAVTINNGGTLAGSGAVAGNVTVNNGGEVAPGNSIDTLSLGANLSFIAGGSFVAEIDSSAAFAVASDLLNIGGNLNIAAGALLSVSDIAGSSQLLAIGTKFTLMSYAGTWDGGMFDMITDGGGIGVGPNVFIVDYNDTTPGLNFPSDTPGGISYVTITAAVPEPTAFLFGGLACGLIGLVHLGRKYLARRTVA